MRTIKLLFVFLAITFSQVSNAQDSKGTDFWLMFPGNLGVPNAIPLYITSDVNTSGTVSIPGAAFSVNFNVIAGTITTVNLPTGTELTSSDFVTNEGVHIISNDEITVYGFSARAFSTDAFLAFPVDAIGTDYIIMSYKNVNIVNGTQFGIVAAEAGTTTVTITPSVTTGARAAGVPYNVILTQGQTYMLRNTVNAGDLTGSIISSDKKVAVFGSHECSNIPSGGVVYCDYLVEQLPPNSAWGTEFVSVPLAGRTLGDTYRILSQTAGTIVQIDGSTVATLGVGQFYEAMLLGYNRITANNPILVGQYSNSGSYDNAPNADPFFLLVPPTDQYLASYTVNTGTPNIPVNYINIVSPTGQTASVLVDGSTPGGAWTAIPGSGFSGLQVSVSTGQHTVSSALPLGVFVYGFGIDDSYGYLGGQSFSPVATVSSFTLTLANAVATQAQTKCVEATVLDQNNNPVVGVKVDFTVQGANTGANFGNTDANGEVTYCYNTCLSGQDTIIATIAGLLDTVYVTVLPSSLTVLPANASVVVGNQQCITATIKDGSNVPVPNAVVNFQVTGDNPVAKTAINTNASGEAVFCYTPLNDGSDVINITAGCSNGNSGVVNVTVTPNSTSPCAATATFQLYGVKPHWVNAGANDDNMFYHGVTEWKRIKAKVNGGVGPYVYSWSNSEGYSMRSPWNNQIYIFEPLGPSYAICTITDVGAGCTFKDSVFIDWTDEYYCGNATEFYKLKMCQGGVSICMSYNQAKAAAIAGTATLGDCPTPKTDLTANAIEFSVYPNPTNGGLTLRYNAVEQSIAQVNVLDVNGRVIQSSAIELIKGNIEYGFDLSNVTNGIYFIQLVTDSDVQIQKLQVLK